MRISEKNRRRLETLYRILRSPRLVGAMVALQLAFAGFCYWTGAVFTAAAFVVLALVDVWRAVKLIRESRARRPSRW